AFIRNIRIGIRPLRVIQQVGGGHLPTKPDPLPQWNVFRQARVDLVRAGPFDGTLCAAPERSEGRRAERGNVKPVARRPVGYIRIGQTVRAQSHVRWRCAGCISRPRWIRTSPLRGEKIAGSLAVNRAQLPSTGEHLDDRIGGGKEMLALSERQLVDDVPGDAVGWNVRPYGSLSLAIVGVLVALSEVDIAKIPRR